MSVEVIDVRREEGVLEQRNLVDASQPTRFDSPELERLDAESRIIARADVAPPNPNDSRTMTLRSSSIQ